MEFKRIAAAALAAVTVLGYSAGYYPAGLIKPVSSITAEAAGEYGTEVGFGSKADFEKYLDDNFYYTKLDTISGTGYISPDVKNVYCYYINKYKGSDANVTIPQPAFLHKGAGKNGYYDACAVIGISNDAFKNNNTIEKVYIPFTVESIGKNAFEGCSSLTTVDIGESVILIGDSYPNPSKLATIGQWAFKGCSALTSFTLPKNVTSVDNYAFEGCSSLASFSVDADNTTFYTDKDGVLYQNYSEESGSGKMLRFFPPANNAERYYVPDDVDLIGINAFTSVNNKNLSVYTNKAARIAPHAFYNCSNIGNVTIQGSPLIYNEFMYESNVTDTLTFDGTPKWDTSGDEAYWFGHCTLKNVVFTKNFVLRQPDDSLADFQKFSLFGVSNKNGCYDLKEGHTYPDMKDSYYNSIEKVQIEGKWNVRFAGELLQFNTAEKQHFFHGVKKVLFTASAADFELGEMMFWGDPELETVQLPANLKEIPKYAFMDTYNLKELNIPETVKTIGASAFENTGVTELYIPYGIEGTGIGTNAFQMTSTNYMRDDKITPNSLVDLYVPPYVKDGTLLDANYGNSKEKDSDKYKVTIHAPAKIADLLESGASKFANANISNVKFDSIIDLTDYKVVKVDGAAPVTHTGVDGSTYYITNSVTPTFTLSNGTSTMDNSLLDINIEKEKTISGGVRVGTATIKYKDKTKAIGTIKIYFHSDLCNEEQCAKGLHTYNFDHIYTATPTCTEGGFDFYHCIFCADNIMKISGTETPSLGGHIWGEPKVDAETGRKYRECSVCGEKEIIKSVSFDEETGTLTLLAGNVYKEDVWEYQTNPKVTAVVAEEGAVLPADCSELFSNYYGINKKYFFDGWLNVVSIDISKADTSNVTDMSRMFCNSQTATLDLSNFDTSNVTNMSEMILGCVNLTSLDLSNFDTSNVQSMHRMFTNCKNLTVLKLSSFNTSNVTDMSEMFRDCQNLTSIDLSSFDTSNVTDMSEMFYSNERLTSLDLSSFDTRNVKDMIAMFAGCANLETITVSDNWTMGNDTKSEGMFGYSYGGSEYYANSLVGGNGTVFDTKHTDDEYARIDKPGQPGYFTGKPAIEAVPAKAATCIEAGNIAYWHDTANDKYYSDEACTKQITKEDTVIAAKGHKWGEWSLDETGAGSTSCANCGEKLYRIGIKYTDADITQNSIKVQFVVPEGAKMQPPVILKNVPEVDSDKFLKALAEYDTALRDVSEDELPTAMAAAQAAIKVKYGETILEAVLAVNEENVIKPDPEDCDEATYTITVKGLEKDTLYSFACSAKLPKGVDEDIPEAVNFVQIKTKPEVKLYDLWINGLGGIQVNSDNCNDILGNGKSELSYDPDTKTLSISGDLDLELGIYSKVDGLTIDVKKDSVLTRTSDLYGDLIDLIGATTITGSGKLKLVNDVNSCIDCEKDLTIKNANIEIIGNVGIYGVYTETKANLTVINSDITIKSSSYAAYMNSVTLDNCYIESPENATVNDLGSITEVVIKAGEKPDPTTTTSTSTAATTSAAATTTTTAVTTAASTTTDSTTTTIARINVPISAVDVSDLLIEGAKLQLTGVKPDGVTPIVFSDEFVQVGEGGMLINAAGETLVWLSGKNATIVFSEDGTYTLKELVAPTGYLMADDVTFIVSGGKILIAGNEAAGVKLVMNAETTTTSATTAATTTATTTAPETTTTAATTSATTTLPATTTNTVATTLPATTTNTVATTLPATTANTVATTLPTTTTNIAATTLPATTTNTAATTLPATTTNTAATTLPATTANTAATTLPATTANTAATTLPATTASTAAPVSSVTTAATTAATAASSTGVQTTASGAQTTSTGAASTTTAALTSTATGNVTATTTAATTSAGTTQSTSQTTASSETTTGTDTTSTGTTTETTSATSTGGSSTTAPETSTTAAGTETTTTEAPATTTEGTATTTEGTATTTAAQTTTTEAPVSTTEGTATTASDIVTTTASDVVTSTATEAATTAASDETTTTTTSTAATAPVSDEATTTTTASTGAVTTVSDKATTTTTASTTSGSGSTTTTAATTAQGGSTTAPVSTTEAPASTTSAPVSTTAAGYAGSTETTATGAGTTAPAQSSTTGTGSATTATGSAATSTSSTSQTTAASTTGEGGTTTTETTPTTQTLPLGDPNGDGKVDAKDASFILVAYAKASTGADDGLTEEQRAAADVNGDGRVDAKDASTVLAYYALISTATGEVPTLEEFARPKSKQ
ncbi:MAG: leucine-rich repeat protein [Ruminococcus sp.]|nr:leucine-rich repeat protein [Ruminococcus sp.]